MSWYKVDAKLTRPRCGSAIKEPDVSIAEAVERVDNSFSSEDEASQRDVVLDHKSCPELPANVVGNSLVDVCSFDSVIGFAPFTLICLTLTILKNRLSIRLSIIYAPPARETRPIRYANILGV